MRTICLLGVRRQEKELGFQRRVPFEAQQLSFLCLLIYRHLSWGQVPSPRCGTAQEGLAGQLQRFALGAEVPQSCPVVLSRQTHTATVAALLMSFVLRPSCSLPLQNRL